MTTENQEQSTEQQNQGRSAEEIAAEVTADLAGEDYVTPGSDQSQEQDDMAGRQNLPPEPGEGEGAGGDDDAGKEKPVASTEKPGDKVADSPKYNPFWDEFKAAGGTIPEAIIKGELEDGKTELQYYNEEVAKGVEEPEVTDPFLKGYNEAEDKQAYLRNHTEAQEIMNLDENAGLRKLWSSQKDDKGERLITDEEIDQSLNDMTPAKKKMEWQQAKEQITANQTKIAEQQNADRKREFLDKLPEYNKEREVLVGKTLIQVDDMKDAGGIPITDEFRDNFKKDFLALSNIEPETGQPLINHWLSKDQNVFEALLAHQLVFKDKEVAGFLSNFKEDYKQNILNKTNLNKKEKPGSTPTTVKSDQDFA